MRSVKQRVLALLLTAAMTCTFVVPAFAAETANPADPAQTNTEETTQAAEGLIEEADLSALQAEQPAAAPAAVEGHAALPKGPMKESATASSGANSKYTDAYDGPASMAFDGDNTQTWHSDYGQSLPQWISWNLGTNGETFEVSKIHYDMKQQKNDGNGRWTQVKVEALLKGKTVHSEQFTVASGNHDLVLSKVVTADAMKITVTGSTGMSTDQANKFACAGELEVFGKKVEGTPAPQPEPEPEPEMPDFEVAGYAPLDKTYMQQTAHASSEEPAVGGNSYGDGPASWAFDGDVGKPWHSKYTGGNAPMPHWIEWDLGAEGESFVVGKVHYDMKNRSDSGNGRWQNVTVEAFLNGKQVYTKDYEVTSGNFDLVLDRPVLADSMKITVNRASANLSCAGELTVYRALPAAEVEPEELPGDLEYKKVPAASITEKTASSAHVTTAQTGDGPADWAFDGKTNTAWHVEYNQTKVPHWIEWHLDGVKTIGQIGYIRNDNGGKNTGNGRWKDVTVSGQLEDGTWKDLRVYTIQEAAMNNDGSEVLIRFVPTAVKALKVTINDSYNSGADKFAQAGEINTYEVTKKASYTMNLTPGTQQVNEGESFTLTAELTADQAGNHVENVQYVWTVQGGILTVAPNGNTAVVTAKAPGKATVRVEAVYGGGTHYAVCQVNVAPQAKTSVIAINGTDHTVKSLKEAVTAAGTQNIESIVFKTGVITPADFEYMQANKTLLDYELKTFRIEDTVVPVGLKDDAIPVNAFKLDNGRGNGLVEVYLGKNIKGIEASAFYKCPDLVSFAAPGVTFLKENALGGTTKLVKLELPALTELKDNSIKDVTVQQLVLPKVTAIGTNALRTFTKLAEVTLGDTVPAIQFRAPLNLASKPTANGVKLYVSEKAMAAYQASAYFADGKWAGLTLTAAPVKPEEITWQSNLVVADGVSVNFYGKIPAELVKDTVVEITVDEKTVTLPVEKAEQTATGEYIFPVATTVRQMTDNIRIEVKQNGQQVGEVLNYTVRDNAEALLSSDTVSAEAKALARAMLYHGAEMQQYKNYRTEDLATKNLSVDEQKALEDAAAAIQAEQLDAYQAARSGKVADLELYGMNLSLMDETTLRYFFVKGEGYQPANFTITDNLGNTYKAEDKGALVSVEIPGIAAAQLDVMIDLTVAAGGETLTVHYGPLSYARSAIKNNTEANGVARSMVLYNQAADNYAASLVK